MTNQIPTLTGCKAEPGGEDIPDNSITHSRSVILSGKGPFLEPYELVNRLHVRPGHFDFEGKLREQFNDLEVGLQEFKLRINSSMPPTSTWTLTVAKSFPATIIREILTDADDESSIIDLAKLGTNDLNLIGLTSDPVIQAGDTTNFKYIAKVAGQPDVVVELTGTVILDPFGQKTPVIKQVANTKVPEGATVTVTFTVERNGQLVGRSEEAVAQVVGKKPPEGEVVEDQPFSDSLGGWILNTGVKGIFDVQSGSRCLRLTGTFRNPALYKNLGVKPGRYRLSFETRNLGHHPSDVYAGASYNITKNACVDQWEKYSVEFNANGQIGIYVHWEPWDVLLGAAIRNLLLVRLADTLLNE